MSALVLRPLSCYDTFFPTESHLPDESHAYISSIAIILSADFINLTNKIFPE